MTDEPAQAPEAEPNPSPERVRVEPSAEPKKTDLLPILYLVGFVALAGTLFYLWQNPPVGHLAPQEASRIDNLQTQVATVRDQVGKLEQGLAAAPGPTQAAFDKLQQQVSALESKPAASAGPSQDAFDKLQQKVTALESKPAAIAGPSQDAFDKLQQQVSALESKPAATPDQLAQLSQQIQGLEKRPQVDPGAIDTKISQLGAQIKQVSDQAQQLSSRLDDVSGKLGPRFDQLQSRLDDLAKQQKQTDDQVNGLAQKMQLATKLQGVAASLAAGQKLGDIPGAPPALARFANEAPPTEASLRASFDKYAAAAEKASQPAVMDNQDFGSRLWARAQQAVTVRQGDRVLLGDPVAGVIAQAREQLDNGDLAGAMKALKGLAGPAAQAMQPWVDRAQSLLDARTAIATMAAG